MIGILKIGFLGMFFVMAGDKASSQEQLKWGADFKEMHRDVVTGKSISFSVKTPPKPEILATKLPAHRCVEWWAESRAECGISIHRGASIGRWNLGLPISVHSRCDGCDQNDEAKISDRSGSHFVDRIFGGCKRGNVFGVVVSG